MDTQTLKTKLADFTSGRTGGAAKALLEIISKFENNEITLAQVKLHKSKLFSSLKGSRQSDLQEMREIITNL